MCGWECSLYIRLCLSTLLTTSQKKKKNAGVNTTVVVYIILFPPHFLWQSEGCRHGWATSTFEGFYCCGEEAIAIERARVALPETDRWEPGCRWWEEVCEDEKKNKTRIKETGFPSMTALSPFLSSPQLSACLLSPSASLPGRQLFCLPDMINGIGQCGAARFGFTLQSQEVRRVPPCLLVGRWRVSWSSPQGHVRQIFFHRSALDCLLFFFCLCHS